jgi:hypothetical protein
VIALDARTAAHLYLDRGFTPIGWYIGRNKAKVAIGRGWTYDDYTVTHADIERWPKCQTGLVMSQRSGYWALDFDCGQDRAAGFFETFAGALPTASQQTGRGIHLVYRGTGGCEWPRDGVWGAKWLDVQVRSKGFIAAAPSWHPSGRQYRWLDDRVPVQPGSMLLAFRPEREPRQGTSYGRCRDDGLDGDLAHYAQHGIPAGWQDTELYRLACRHVRDMDPEELAGWLWACASRSQQKIWDRWRPSDIRNKIRRAAEFIGGADAKLTAATAGWEPYSHGR